MFPHGFLQCYGWWPTCCLHQKPESPNQTRSDPWDHRNSLNRPDQRLRQPSILSPRVASKKCLGATTRWEKDLYPGTQSSSHQNFSSFLGNEDHHIYQLPTAVLSPSFFKPFILLASTTSFGNSFHNVTLVHYKGSLLEGGGRNGAYRTNWTGTDNKIHAARR